MRLGKGLLIICISILLQSCCFTGNHYSHDLEAGKSRFEDGEYDESFRRLYPIAYNGDPQAEYAIGYMYYYGYGVPRDSDAGIYWMDKAAMQGYRPAIRAMNIIHERTLYPSYPERRAITSPVPPPRRPVTYEPPLTKRITEKKEVKEGREGIFISKDTSRHFTYNQSASMTIPDKKYSLQMFGSYHLDDVKNLQKRLTSKETTTIWHTQHNGKDWYVLTYGQYTSMAQAILAKDQLPAEIKQAGLWIRNVSGLELVDGLTPSIQFAETGKANVSHQDTVMT